MTDPIQEQLIAARKDQILDAAATVFAERGFHATTIRDISKYAGISDGTIYNYFDNKTALLLGIFERMRASILQRDMPLPPVEMDFRAFIRASLTYPVMALRGNNFALFRIVLSEMMVNEELRTLYYTQILQPSLAAAEGQFALYAAQAGIDPAKASLTVRAVSSMVLGLIVESIMGDNALQEQQDELLDLLTDFVVKGLGE